MGRRVLYAILVVLFLAGGCETDFDPRGAFLDRLVVYAVLTPINQEHYVRLSSTYDPPGFNPLDFVQNIQVSTATVSIAVDTTVIALRDTVVSRDDLGRYTDSISAFVASPLTIQRGKNYILTVNSPTYGVLIGSTLVPKAGQIEIDNDSRFSLTSPAAATRDILISAIPYASAEGHMVRVFIEYELPVANPGVIVTAEVPLEITDYRDCTTYSAAYPRARRRELNSSREIWRFALENYRRILIRILKENEGMIIAFKRIYVELVQTDEHLYKYYSVVNGFQDQFSIRVDQPNYTNIQRGLGVFGSFTSDTTIVSSTLAPNFPDLTCTN